MEHKEPLTLEDIRLMPALLRRLCGVGVAVPSGVLERAAEAIDTLLAARASGVESLPARELPTDDKAS
jgi:hypothetical protein